MWHSCVRVSVRDHLRGKPRHLVALYRELGRTIRSFGPGVTTVSSRTRTGWMARARFAGVQFRRDHLLLGFWLKREISSARLKRTYLGRSDWIYELPIGSATDLDHQLIGWLREAYLVGRQEWPADAAERGARRPERMRKGRPGEAAPSDRIGEAP
jgi:hypothetical protein